MEIAVQKAKKEGFRIVTILLFVGSSHWTWLLKIICLGSVINYDKNLSYNLDTNYNSIQQFWIRIS